MADTIVALSSGVLPAAIAVVRLSGPHAFDAATGICGSLPQPREARVRTLRHDGRVLDRALVLSFPGPETATGEDLVEFHLHGGRAVVDAVEQALLKHANVRAAVQGEFTRRALANGRIDLIGAEALGDLLAAETEAQRRLAVEAGSGMLRRNIDRIEERLLRMSAQVELMLDFSDEDDAAAEQDAMIAIRQDLADLTDFIDRWTSAPTVDRVRDGYRVVLAGPPNAGKSTLLNRLVDRDVAIVSDIAGTTRDRIEVSVSREGLPFVLTDTAGLNDGTDDPIELVGIERTRGAIADADVVLWLGDEAAPVNAIALHTRNDLSDRSQVPTGRLAVSAMTGAGIDELWSMLVLSVRDRLPPADGRALNDRQRGLLVQCAGYAKIARQECEPLLIAEQLKLGRRCLDQITGKSGTEQMLDALFGRFCIGK